MDPAAKSQSEPWRGRGPQPPPALRRCGSGSELPLDLERHLAGPGPQTLARTLQRSSPLRRDRTHTHIHSPGPTRSLRGQPKTCRAAHTHSLWVPHTPHPPSTASDPAPRRPRGAAYLSRRRRCGVRSSSGLGRRRRPPRTAAAVAAAAGARTESAG